VLLIAGCGRFLELDQVVAPDAPPPCTPSPISDDFEATTPLCGSWGLLNDANGLVSRSNGQLVFTPMPNMNEYSSCVTANTFQLGPEGVLVELGMVPSGSYGNFQVKTYDELTSPTPSTATSANFTTTALDVVDQLTCSGTTCTHFKNAAFVADQMKWLRFLPTVDAMGLTLQFSPDAHYWTDYVTRDLTPFNATFVRVTLAGGATGGPAPTPVSYNSLGLCP